MRSGALQHAPATAASEVPPDCRAGRHLPGRRVTIDPDGVAHARCRRCGCELTRLPAIRRWYRSGLIG
ncbi:hypothetical protein [Sphingomonas sp. BK235]|uniref:hypothetical protein n=1 Tax=Sphingomonas sp. BK235 TaxID=2512131 RepID=UPI001047BE00|nr:hypothetical protein [Sphingomonas sp. BK235]TCP36858.1 hypothetical protein EV292_101360 [Sphingomonas sp. BK235]